MCRHHPPPSDYSAAGFPQQECVCKIVRKSSYYTIYYAIITQYF
ncbi:hypothetical protein HMPREF1574_01246 [Gardnerella pickettii JCP7659]|uniref:Uncharacterized protein n=2 Tax=Gardnerella pickettii TaxID=2914924 RepID=T2PJ69_9BIFI|nr:hypothetical protein HMPREF1577_01255 [Gardnerella pickettii JCP8017A]EPI54202.1 hypothetical protein HMPREF1574_01246 [Gardnerella pickettii JCP7659]EPI61614.1 hypothetical protein HMPREF1578_00819 [Gardnerella pickettii JCP8017B]